MSLKRIPKYRPPVRRKKKQLSREVRILKRMITKQTEIKQKEEFDSGIVTNGSVGLYELTNIAVGPDDDDRIGNKITVKSYGLKMYFDSSPNVPFNTFRVTVVRCLQEDINANEIYDTSVAGANNYAMANRNPNFVNKYQILFDKEYTLNNKPYWDNVAGLLKYTNVRKHITLYKKLNHQVHFKGNASVDAQSGSIYLMLSCLEGVGNGVSFVSLQKMRYTDL